jgi:hypothetical protein
MTIRWKLCADTVMEQYVKLSRSPVPTKTFHEQLSEPFPLGDLFLLEIKNFNQDEVSYMKQVWLSLRGDGYSG